MQVCFCYHSFATLEGVNVNICCLENRNRQKFLSFTYLLYKSHVWFVNLDFCMPSDLITHIPLDGGLKLFQKQLCEHPAEGGSQSLLVFSCFGFILSLKGLRDWTGST